MRITQFYASLLKKELLFFYIYELSNLWSSRELCNFEKRTQITATVGNINEIQYNVFDNVLLHQIQITENQTKL